MSQKTITSYYNSKKRRAPDDIVTSKSKIPHLDNFDGKTESGIVTPFISKSAVSQNEVIRVFSTPVEYKTEVTKNTLIETAQAAPPQDNTEEQIFIKKSSNLSKFPKSEAINIARKELSLGDIRKKLGGSSKRAQLKASAERISKGIQQLKEAGEKRNLKEFKSIDVEVPSSPSKKSLNQKELLSPKKETPTAEFQRPFISPRKVIVSPIKSPTKIPAYLRQTPLPVCPTSLPLPHHYRFLVELFRSMETVISLLYNRNEKITFSKLKPSIQEMLKRNFTEKHLAQIKKMVPDFYNFEIHKVKSFSDTNKKQQYELVISPNFPSEIRTMNPTVLLERRRYFCETLIKLVKKHHAKYLLTLDPPMVISDDKLTRWHPEFDVEKVPDIEYAKLPEIPNQNKFSTALDVLAKARELLKCNTKMERALEKLAQAKERGLTEQEKKVTGIIEQTNVNTTGTQTLQTSLPSGSGVTLLNPALRNLPPALLEKVKAKQAARALEAMTRSSEHEKKYLIYSRLPDLARTLRNIFVTERKNVLALNIILSKLDNSFKASVVASDLEKDIKILTEEAPEWIKLHVIRNNTYLKLDRNADLKKILGKLEVLAEKYRNY